MSCTLLIDLGLQSVDLIADDPDLLLLRVKLIDLLLVQLAPEPPLEFVELQRCKLLEVGEVYFACGRLRVLCVVGLSRGLGESPQTLVVLQHLVEDVLPDRSGYRARWLRLGLLLGPSRVEPVLNELWVSGQTQNEQRLHPEEV